MVRTTSPRGVSPNSGRTAITPAAKAMTANRVKLSDVGMREALDLVTWLGICLLFRDRRFVAEKSKAHKKNIIMSATHL